MALHAVSVRQATPLPPTSFIPIAIGTPRDGHPCLKLTLPTAKRVRDFHPRVIAHAGHTTRNT
ncbi:hypothetical protein [Algoriphagus boritolerans]|uniref:hypothetical protein n=1 Tax=Algoriphagus boritolerans TaxID=308111 RepID=UPI002FCDE23B